MNRITIVVADRSGLIAELCGLLAARHINVAAIDGRVVGTDAILHIEVDELPSAVAILTGAGCRVMSDDVVTFEVEDVPGALALISRELAEGGIDIRMMHTINRNAGRCIVAIATNSDDRAKALLAERLL